MQWCEQSWCNGESKVGVVVRARLVQLCEQWWFEQGWHTGESKAAPVLRGRCV